MYTPKHFEERDVTVLHALIRSHPLGAWVTQAEEGLVVNHIPFPRRLNARRVRHAHWSCRPRKSHLEVLYEGNGVRGNFSRTPDIHHVPPGIRTKHAHGKAVPTWNYAVVHAHGLPRAIDDRDWLLKHVTELSDLHESESAVPWSVSDAPPDYIDTMLKAIVGIEISISTRSSGKWKISQNRPLPDKLGTIAGLL